MPRRQYAPRLPLLSYAVSTPTYTLRVDVSPAGLVRHCAPCVRRQWLGQDAAPGWRVGRQWAHQTTGYSRHTLGKALRITPTL